MFLQNPGLYNTQILIMLLALRRCAANKLVPPTPTESENRSDPDYLLLCATHVSLQVFDLAEPEALLFLTLCSHLSICSLQVD